MGLGKLETDILLLLFRNPTERFTTNQITGLLQGEEYTVHSVKSRLLMLFHRINAAKTLPFYKASGAEGNKAFHWYDPEQASLLVDYAVRHPVRHGKRENSDEDKEIFISRDGIPSIGGKKHVVSPVASGLLRLLREFEGSAEYSELLKGYKQSYGDISDDEFYRLLRTVSKELADRQIDLQWIATSDYPDDGTFQPRIRVSGFVPESEGSAPKDEVGQPDSFVSEASEQYLRSKQGEVLHKLAEYITSRQPTDVRGYIVAPTGAGKTVLFTRLLEDLRVSGIARRSLIVVPTKQLVAQTRAALATYGFTGSVALIEGSRSYSGRHDAVIITAAAFARRMNGTTSYTLNHEEFDLIVFDEAHHLQGKASHEALKTKLQNTMQIGFTATPDYDTKRRLRYILPDEVAEVTIHEAIDEKMVAPYVVARFKTHTDVSTVPVLRNEYDQEELQRVINVENRNNSIARFGASVLGATPTLYNCSRIEHAENIAAALRHHGVRAVAIHGSMDEPMQAAILQAFRKGEITSLVQVRLLGEGFDEPRIEAVVNVDPTLSEVRAKQRAGRGMRLDLNNNPRKMTIIVECEDDNYSATPIFYDDQRAARLPYYTPEDFVPTKQQQNILGRLQVHAGVVMAGELENSTTEAQLDLAEFNFTPVNVSITAEKSPTEGAKKPKKRPVARIREHASGKADEEYRAYLAAYADYAELATPKTPEDFINKQRGETHQGIAAFLFGGAVGMTDEAAVDHIMKRAPKAVRNVLKEAVSNTRLQAEIHSNRLRLLQEALMQQAQSVTVEAVSVAVRSLQNSINERRPVWSAGGQCNGLHESGRFFPERGESTTEQKEICRQCGVASLCLKFSLENGERFGIWGGLSERERRRMRRALAEFNKTGNPKILRELPNQVNGSAHIVQKFLLETYAETLESTEPSLKEA